MPAAQGAARAAFIEANLGLAHACANRFRGRGIEYDDLFQAACCGLVKACDGFDRERGFLFSTYAVPVILGEVKRLFRDGGSVKVSRRLKELARKANAARELLEKRGNGAPGLRELAQHIECDEETLVEALCCARPPVSLTVFDDEESAQREIAVHDAGLERVTDNASLEVALLRLSPQERLVLRERYCHDKTQTEIAQMIGASQVGVSRLEKRILHKLRDALE